jgi:hypothetical protein
VKDNLSDLIDKIKWCRGNDLQCKKIAMNARKLAEKILTEDECFKYIANVMNSF